MRFENNLSLSCLEGFLTLVIIKKNEDSFAFRIDNFSAGQSGCFASAVLLGVILLPF